MTINELVAVLRLQCIPNIGDVTAKKLIAHCGSPTAVFADKRKQLEKIDGIGTITLRGLQDAKYHKMAEAEAKYVQDNGIALSYYLDEAYPEYLKHCVDGPLLLFKRGNIDLNGRKIISIVGTRKVTSYGIALCERLISDLVPLDPIIVSGYAYGVDICVQKAAIKHGLQTIGCLAHGLNQTYPKAHSKFNTAVEANGGFLTEFWSTSTPEREHFLKRNRIIAGMAEATVVIESAEKGGSLVTADIANSYSREVFAFPGRAQDTYSIGCNNLIKQQKAHMITQAADLVFMLGWELDTTAEKGIQKQLFVSLEKTEKTIYDYLHTQGKQQLDSIALECKIPIFKVSSTLLNMEMKGVVRPLPGKLFEAI